MPDKITVDPRELLGCDVYNNGAFAGRIIKVTVISNWITFTTELENEFFDEQVLDPKFGITMTDPDNGFVEVNMYGCAFPDEIPDYKITLDQWLHASGSKSLFHVGQRLYTRSKGDSSPTLRGVVERVFKHPVTDEYIARTTYRQPFDTQELVEGTVTIGQKIWYEPQNR